MIGYTCAYLRYYYPIEFITAYLNNANNDDDINMGTGLAQQLNIKIHPVKFRHSLSKYTCDKNGIYKGLGSIKYLSEQMSQELYELRDKLYDSFFDLLIDIQKTSVDSRQLEILVKLDFFSEFGEPNKLLKQVVQFNNIYSKKQFKKEKLAELDLPQDLVAKYAEKETEKMFTKVDTSGLLNEIAQNYKYPETTLMDKVKYQMECLGYIDIVDPEADKRLYCVTKVDVRKSIINADIYELHSGKTQSVKLWRKDFDMNPFAEGNILYLYRVEKKNKREPSSKINPKTGKPIWVAVPDKWEFWLQSYRIEGGDLEYYD